MREYYPVKINLNRIIYYMLWFTGEDDGFISELSKPLLFSNFNDLDKYAKNINIKLESDLTVYNFEAITNWIENPKSPSKYELFLDSWNFFNDLSKSTDSPFKGNFDSGNTVDVYNKLFYGLNLPTLKKNGEEFTPKWDEQEIEKLRDVLEDGISILLKYIKYVK